MPSSKERFLSVTGPEAEELRSALEYIHSSPSRKKEKVLTRGVLREITGKPGNWIGDPTSSRQLLFTLKEAEFVKDVVRSMGLDVRVQGLG